MNALQLIINQQVAFQDRLRGLGAIHYSKMTYQERLTFLATATAKEAFEFLDATHWKPHKRNYGEPLTEDEREHALEEAIDVLHCVVAMFIELGVTDEQEILGRFEDKNQVNNERQDQRY